MDANDVMGSRSRPPPGPLWRVWYATDGVREVLSAHRQPVFQAPGGAATQRVPSSSPAMR